MQNEVKNANKNSPTMTKDEIKWRTAEAKVRLLEAKADGETVKAQKSRLELDKSCDKLVYIDTALNEFNEKLGVVMAEFRGLPARLASELKLSPAKHEVMQAAFDDILKSLSKIEFKFETASEIDERAAASHAKGTTEAASKKGKKK